ncbi:MAG: squalene synthase HpnC [Rhodospirillales bacterium]|nr:squalene synthase HpnC [Rhodospirillales bacterium]
MALPDDPGRAVETPSGKDAAYENFPVGSWLLPARLRPHIAKFYAFARAIDDIADSPDLDPKEKVKRLDGFERALLGKGKSKKKDDPAYATAQRMRESLAETGIKPDHCLGLIAAFKQDATKLRYKDWDDLMGYCIKSAAPVGRYLLDLHGGSDDGYGPSDALCNALQVINHLQDCQDDYASLDRVYLPQDWMTQAGMKVEDLGREQAGPEVRRVIDRCLDATGGLLAEAQALPGGLKSRRLAMESSAILEIAFQLTRMLRDRDPLGPNRVQLTKPDYLWCCLRGVLRTWI